MNETPQDLPAALPADFARPTPAYRRQAWLAMSGLAAFMVLYLLLAAWFLLASYRLTFGAASGSAGIGWGYLLGACAAFLAVFMLKALFFVKRGDIGDSLEVTPQQQPKLFEFLYQLADKAGAPRPYRVFLSARVNAAVFYDLSIVNLFFPSRKNLEIGLGLVNALSLGEFQAVLAHEFGHFAQRAMAVGRWVYVAQQIAAHLVARRDKLDDFLRALSHFDFRTAWVGWILSLIVWSIRSLVESAFNVVVLMQRALSREMEMQADLVAVRLTGSDALIHALHRLQGADDSWERALGFVFREKANGHFTRDFFAIQSRVMTRMGQLLNDTGYNQVPPVPVEQPHSHRLFKATLAQPPKMWLTHPLNHEREANAKRHYVRAPIDARSAWDLFDDPVAMREQVTANLLGAAGADPVPTEDSLRALDLQFEREYLKGHYRGIYMGRSVVRSAARVEDLYGTADKMTLRDLERLYPESLSEDVEQLRSLENELAQLRELHAGVLTPAGGVIRHDGKELKEDQLPHVIEDVGRRAKAVEQRLHAHDSLCRTVHLAAAAQLGAGWPEYLRGLLALQHYADHTEANLRDAQGLLANTVNIETATRRVSASGVERVIAAASQMYRVLDQVFEEREQVAPDSLVMQRLQTASWEQRLGEWKFPPPYKGNINEWLKAADSWVDQAAGACAALRTNALEQLLVSEAELAVHARQGKPMPPAPEPARVPSAYATLVPGQERKRQNRLGWWARFQTADGMFPALVRLGVAGGIVATVLFLGDIVGSATVTVYNGLARPVLVRIDSSRLQVPAFASVSHRLDADRTYTMTTSTLQGKQIETFDAEVRGSFASFVYNVAGASPLVEWSAIYGTAQAMPERQLGAPRWTTSTADVLFSEPPQSVRTKGGGAVRIVLAALADTQPPQQVEMLKDEAQRQGMIRAHARWDTSDSRHAEQWLQLARSLPDFDRLLAARLSESPDDVVLLRAEQETAGASNRSAVCARHQARSDAAPGNADLKYITVRCIADDAARTEAFLAGRRQWPTHGWFAYAAGYSEAEVGHWEQALAALDQVRRQLHPMADSVTVDLFRIRRLWAPTDQARLTELVNGSSDLQFMLGLEKGEKLEAPEFKAYAELARGHLGEALRLAHLKPENEARVIRLAAASDGASPQLIARALALGANEGLDETSMWSSIALATRMQRDFTPYLPAATRLPQKYGDALLQFITQLNKEKNPEAAERMLEGLTPGLRGQAYSMGVILLEQNAPRHWRDAAKRLLFIPERPYFE